MTRILVSYKLRIYAEDHPRRGQTAEVVEIDPCCDDLEEALWYGYIKRTSMNAPPTGRKVRSYPLESEDELASSLGLGIISDAERPQDRSSVLISRCPWCGAEVERERAERVRVVPQRFAQILNKEVPIDDDPPANAKLPELEGEP